MARIRGHELDRTKYATKFYNSAHDLVLWVSGRHLGIREIAEDERPVLGEELRYEPVKTVEVNDRRMAADEAVFRAVEIDE